jgi:hypothetical protein
LQRKFHQRVELLALSGDHLRYLPGASAQRMVELGSAAVHNENGRVKSLRLLQSAQTHLLRIGPPDAAARFGTRFYRWAGELSSTTPGHSTGSTKNLPVLAERRFAHNPRTRRV